jgi:hypothetical protein
MRERHVLFSAYGCFSTLRMSPRPASQRCSEPHQI